MISEMASAGKECLRHPRKVSVWVPALGRYVCPDSEDGRRALAETGRPSASPRPEEAYQSRIDPHFKLVFLTAAGGTLLFVAVCVALTWLRGADMPAPVEKLVTGLFDLAKIGFGAVVGLLGGKVLEADGRSKSRTNTV